MKHKENVGRRVCPRVERFREIWPPVIGESIYNYAGSRVDLKLLHCNCSWQSGLDFRATCEAEIG